MRKAVQHFDIRWGGINTVGTLYNADWFSHYSFHGLLLYERRQFSMAVRDDDFASLFGTVCIVSPLWWLITVFKICLATESYRVVCISVYVNFICSRDVITRLRIGKSVRQVLSSLLTDGVDPTKEISKSLPNWCAIESFVISLTLGCWGVFHNYQHNLPRSRFQLQEQDKAKLLGSGCRYKRECEEIVEKMSI